MARDERYFGKTIAEHFDNGSCWLCGEVVDRSRGYHGATGAHWACTSALTKQYEALSQTPSARPFLARANGGHFVHTVDPISGASLCGHRPHRTQDAAESTLDSGRQRATRVQALSALRAPRPPNSPFGFRAS